MARRQQDQQTAPLWVEEGTPRTAPLITVAPLAPIDRLYTFTTDPDRVAQLRLGQRVAVPMGRSGRLTPALIVAIAEGPWTSTLKPLADSLDRGGELSPHLLELGQWIARYYCAPLGRTLAAMIPQAARQQRGFTTVRRLRLALSASETANARLGPKQQQIIDRLRQEDGWIETDALLAAAGASRATLRTLLSRGWVEEEVVKEARDSALVKIDPVEPEFELNADQRQAIRNVEAALDAAQVRAQLLYGVSGSGKTEVYVHTIRRVVKAGRQAILLVPEIALTTQLVQRLAARFDRVAVVHSGLTDAARSLTWEAITSGTAAVVIGTRSAVFAPCPDLGILVVDEEQESSYKNLQSPRFHVRDVAIKRAQLLNIPVLLGSATPSLETWQNARAHPAYERIDLPHRVRTLPLPAVRVVDTRGLGDPREQRLAPPLVDALTGVLADHGQAILLLNRRGFATWLFCPECSRRVNCPHCQAALVLHQGRNRLVCHHCHRQTPVPALCADMTCQGRLVHGGGGTERVESMLRSTFPQARVRRADSDTMTHADRYADLVGAVESGAVDILVGTQMIAKGLDFPNVTLVGVLGAELTASAGDFRAAERLFQLVTQVAGRAGRSAATGQVIIQSGTPDLPVLQHALTHDYVSFADEELLNRRQRNMPPFMRMTRIVLSAARESEVQTGGDQLADGLRAAAATVPEARAEIFGPHPCVIERIRDQYRFEVILQAASAGSMLAVLQAARLAGALPAARRGMIIDVDPVALA